MVEELHTSSFGNSDECSTLPMYEIDSFAATCSLAVLIRMSGALDILDMAW